MVGTMAKHDHLLWVEYIYFGDITLKGQQAILELNELYYIIRLRLNDSVYAGVQFIVLVSASYLAKCTESKCILLSSEAPETFAQIQC